MSAMWFGYLASYAMLAGAAFMLMALVASYGERGRRELAGFTAGSVAVGRLMALAIAAALCFCAYGWALFVRWIG